MSEMSLLTPNPPPELVEGKGPMVVVHKLNCFTFSECYLKKSYYKTRSLNVRQRRI